MARPKKNRDEGGGASWMDTYGDLVTLLLCFFVMLFASSTISEEKWIRIVESFTGAPPGSIIAPIDMSAPIEGFEGSDMGPRDELADVQAENLEQAVDAVNDRLEEEKSEEQKQIEEQFDELYEKLNAYIVGQGLENALMLEKDGIYIYLTIAEGILFDSAQADIRDEEAEGILQTISAMVSQYLDDIQQITVEGHTDNNPISNNLYDDNLDLSSKRANNVARFMNEVSEIPMELFWSLGRSEFDPIATNDTAEGRQRNRRVKLILIAKDVDGIQQARLGTEVTGLTDGTLETGGTLDSQEEAELSGDGVVEEIINEEPVQGEGVVEEIIDAEQSAAAQPANE